MIASRGQRILPPLGLVTLVAVAGVISLLGSPASGQPRNQVSTPTEPPTTESPSPRLDPEQVSAGGQLYLTGCTSCHGADGDGVPGRGPSLLRSGGAAAYYYLTTGRMPLNSTYEQPQRKEPAYTPEEIDQLVAYVQSLGDGPRVPDVDVDQGDLSRGGVLFRANCAPCHNAAGIGGALSYGRAAPSLQQSSPLVVGSAMRSGPGQMIVFGPDVISREEMNSIARYVQFLRDPPNPGGSRLGGAGPIPEGFVAWILGIGPLVLAAVWIGTRKVSG